MKHAEKTDAGAYSIYTGSNSLTDLKLLLGKNEYKDARVFILVDENTLKHCLPILIEQVSVLSKAEILEIESGEENKNIELCNQLWLTLSEYGADRGSLLINLGGGVISDLGGFVAATYKRGVRYINIPTTLLAQVDASIGGKTGVDLNYIKNQIGVFSYPQAVFIFPNFIDTVDERQLISGTAEMFKHGLIADKKHWQLLSEGADFTGEFREELIHQSIEIKNKIVLIDPREQGIRKALNFGHTIGHALETYSLESDNITLLHGEAIAIGMICEAWLSNQKAGLSKAELAEITQVLLKKFKQVNLKRFDNHRLIELMRNDKKNKANLINFTLLSEIGKAVIDQNCSIELIKESLNYYAVQAKMV